MNIKLKHVDSPVVHSQSKRIIQADRDDTKTSCGITLPTRIIAKTPSIVSCPLCKKAGS